jgi:hypothetical protein
MWLLYLGLAPLIVLIAAWLIRRKMYRDTAVFAAISLAGFGLWASVVHDRPIFLNTAISRILMALMPWTAG